MIDCILTSNVTCPDHNPDTSNILLFTTLPVTPVSVSIVASTYAVMPGTTVSFTATPTNGGANPTYQWNVNGNPTGTGPVYSYNTPSNNDNIQCFMTSSIPGCLSSNPTPSNIVNLIVYTTGTPCSGVATVQHLGITYNTVQIGSQCWLRENINAGTLVNSSQTQTNNGIMEKWCYDNDPLNCNVYGALYQWAEMVQYYNGVTNTTHWNPVPTVPVQGVCPPGWHLPTKAESDALITFLGGQSVAGGKIKEAGIAHWRGPSSIANPVNVGATNSSGFTSLPGGHSYLGNFENIHQYGNMWTITKGQFATDIWYFGAAYNYTSTTSGQGYKVTGYYARCLKN